MPRTPKQYDEIREQRRIQIMDTALDLFSKEGYGHVSIAMLAKKAGISKGLMYNYFESKEHLLKEILDNALEEIASTFDPDRDGILTPEELEIFIRSTFSLMRENMDFYIKFYSLFVQPNVKEYLKQSSAMIFFQKFMKLFYEYFERQGFEDPMLEVLNIAVSIEGMGVIMMYADELEGIPEDIFKKFEDRIIKQYT